MMWRRLVDSNQNTREHPIDRNLRILRMVAFSVVMLGFGALFVVVVAQTIWNAHVIHDRRPSEENYSFFLSECAKARFDQEQCAFLGRVGRITGRPSLEEKGEGL